MRKSTRIVKRALALFLVVLMSINTFAAVVGDNDGAAFITKAEFDSLKNDFQSQLDTYNSSIDNKIDGAIAAYLSGINISTQTPMLNSLMNVKLNNTQYVKDILWTNKNNYRINPNDFTNGDTQWIAQDITFYASTVIGNQTKVQNVIYRKVASTSEARIEVDSNNRVLAWGDYTASVTGACFQFDDVGTRTSASTGFYFPYPAERIANVMRRPKDISWSIFQHWINRTPAWSSVASQGLCFPEGSWVKYMEKTPSDYETFDLTQFCIAPLSTVIESTLPPAPKDTDPPFQLTTDNNTFGNYCRSAYLQTFSDIKASEPTEVTATFSKMENAENAGTNDALEGRAHKDLSARWFNLVIYNELSLAKVDEVFNMNIKFKCGLPLTVQDSFQAEEIIKFNVSDINENGYLIFYVSQAPDEDWGGNKTNYAIEKWKVTKNNSKTIEVNINQRILGNIFVVWLPDNDCKLPTIDIYRVR